MAITTRCSTVRIGDRLIGVATMAGMTHGTIHGMVPITPDGMADGTVVGTIRGTTATPGDAPTGDGAALGVLHGTMPTTALPAHATILWAELPSAIVAHPQAAALSEAATEQITEHVGRTTTAPTAARLVAETTALTTLSVSRCRTNRPTAILTMDSAQAVAHLVEAQALVAASAEEAASAASAEEEVVAEAEALAAVDNAYTLGGYSSTL